MDHQYVGFNALPPPFPFGAVTVLIPTLEALFRPLHRRVDGLTKEGPKRWSRVVDLIDWKGVQMTPLRRTAFVAGLLFITTFVTSIPAVLLYRPVVNHANYLVGAGADTRIALGALLEMILIIANVGTAVVLFPILKRQNEDLALGYVAARLLESAFIAIGIVSLLAVVTLRKDVGGPGGAGSLVSVGRSLVAIRDWTFVLGPGWVVGVGNGLLLGYLMYRSGLVPRGMAMLGLIGGPLIIASGTAVLFGAIERGSKAQGIATIPEFLWELSLVVYLMVKGFRPSPITAGLASPAPPSAAV